MKHPCTALALAALSLAPRGLYAQPALRVGGREAPLGVRDFRPASTGVEEVIPFTTTGALYASQAVSPDCRGGWVSQRPDLIVRLRAAVPGLRVWVTGVRALPSPDDPHAVVAPNAALVLNGADGRWRCDAAWGPLGPQIVVPDAGVGQYDIWVGPLARGVRLSGDLHIASVPSLMLGGAQAHAGVHELPTEGARDTLDLPLTSRPRGAVDLRTLGEGCSGFAPERPDAIVRVPAALPLFRVTAQAGRGSSLALHLPDGRWRCRDVPIVGDPLLVVRDAPAGLYEVWVGTRAEGDVAGTLQVTRAPLLETGSTRGTFGDRELAASFSPDRFSFEVPQRPAGPVDARLLTTPCAGRIERRPDYVLHLTQPLPMLRVFATASVDTTLVVRAPDDAFHCDDDGYGGFNPLVEMSNAAAGNYEVWLGAFNPTTPLSGTVYVTRSPLVELGGDEATLGVRELAPNFSPERFDVDVPDRGPGDVNASVFSRGCAGVITRRPDVILNVSGPMPFLRLYTTGATPQRDATLVVHNPDDTWTCHDDWEARAGNLNPSVDLPRVTRGRYEVWVGTVGRTGHFAGVLHVTRNPQHHP